MHHPRLLFVDYKRREGSCCCCSMMTLVVEKKIIRSLPGYIFNVFRLSGYTYICIVEPSTHSHCALFNALSSYIYPSKVFIPPPPPTNTYQFFCFKKPSKFSSSGFDLVGSFSDYYDVVSGPPEMTIERLFFYCVCETSILSYF